MFAQSIEDIEATIWKRELDKAKTSVDAFLTKEKNAAKPDGWWYKGLIYNEIAKSENTRHWRLKAAWMLLMLLKNIMNSIQKP